MGCSQLHRGIFVAVNTNIKIKKKEQFTNLTFQLKNLEKEQQVKCKASIRMKINQRQNK